ncbi:MAG: Holliday junction resolvase RuvX [Actinomycetota bacterium]|nr:Holliday junction resolvase RuvX [Actinomycetota bacterium]
MRILGLDIGERRIGVAVSDPGLRVASPVKVLDARAIAGSSALRQIVEDYEIDQVVVGLPLSLDGTEGPQAQHVRQVVGELADLLGLPVHFYDERFSSVEAGRAMQAAGLSERQKRGSVDMVAAALLLQGYLDSLRSTGVDETRDTD